MDVMGNDEEMEMPEWQETILDFLDDHECTYEELMQFVWQIKE